MRMHPTLSAAKAMAVLTIALTSIGIAVFLRACKGNYMREAITQMLGYEQRAAIEHLLAGVGVPLSVGVPCLAVTFVLCLMSYWVCKQVQLTWPPLAKHPSEVVTLKDLPLIVGIWSIVYALAAVIWEWNQAYIGVYGGNPRGYVQWDQLCSDLGGAFIAFLFVRQVVAPRPARPLNTE